VCRSRTTGSRAWATRWRGRRRTLSTSSCSTTARTGEHYYYHHHCPPGGTSTRSRRSRTPLPTCARHPINVPPNRLTFAVNDSTVKPGGLFGQGWELDLPNPGLCTYRIDVSEPFNKAPPVLRYASVRAEPLMPGVRGLSVVAGGAGR
jgi:hypothetical protein